MGLIADITAVLADAKVNIVNIKTSGLKDRGAIIVTTPSYDEALMALSAAGFKAVSEDTVIVKLDNVPGAVAKVSGKLKDAGIDIRSLDIVHNEDDYSLIAIATQQNDKVRQILADVLIE